jgi:hypothetical protein
MRELQYYRLLRALEYGESLPYDPCRQPDMTPAGPCQSPDEIDEFVRIRTIGMNSSGP